MLDNPKLEIYTPVDSSNLKSLVPSGEKILCSTMCEGRYSYLRDSSEYFVSWNTHVLLTTGGLVYTETNYDKSTENRYIPWHKIDIDGKFIYINIRPCLYPSANLGKRKKHATQLRHIPFTSNLEGSQDIVVRTNRFEAVYIPFLMNKKKNWIEANKDNQDLDKKEMKQVVKSLEIMDKREEIKIQKEQKRIQKEQKRLQKEQKKNQKKG